MRRIIAVEHPVLDSAEIEEVCLSIIVNEKTSNSLRDYPALFAVCSANSLPELKKVVSVMARKYRDEEDLPIYIKLGDIALPLIKSSMGVSLARLILSDPEKAEKEIGYSAVTAASFVWRELLEWQTIFSSSKYKSVEKLMSSVQKELLHLIAAGIERPKHIECFTLLEALKNPTIGASFRVTVPNLIVLRSDGQPLNEYDAVSLILKSNKETQLWLWEATDVQSIRKIKKDIRKMHDLKEKIDARWGNQIEIVVCHVSSTGDDLLLDIGGVQRRIPIA